MLAIAGGKGGCGKTTTALGLARGLASLGADPLVVDADIDMPDLHHRAGTDHTPGVAAAAKHSQPMACTQRSPRFPGVDVLPCCEADAATASRLYEQLRRYHRPVLLDCPAGAGPDAARPLRVADGTVLVSTPIEQSLRDTVKTAAMARHLDAPPVAVVLVRSDGSVDPTPLLDCPDVVHIPDVEKPPLETRESTVRYRQYAESLDKRNI